MGALHTGLLALPLKTGLPDVLVDEKIETGEVDEGDDSCEEEPSPVCVTHRVHRI